MLAGEQREFGIETDAIHGTVTELDAMLAQKVDEPELELQHPNVHANAIVRPSSEGQIRHGRLLRLILGTEALRIEAFRLRPVLKDIWFSMRYAVCG